MGILSKGDNGSITKSMFMVMAGGILSLAAGLVSQIVTAAFFGAGADMDAFLTALIIPNYLLYVLVNGLSFVVVPAFIREETTGSQEDAWSIVGTFFWLTAGILALGAIVISINAHAILEVTASNLSPAKLNLAAEMLSIMAFNLPFAGLNEFAVGLQNARGRFFWPAAATAIGSLGNIAVLLFSYRAIGSIALAWGNLVSVGLTASIPLLPLVRHGWKKLIPLSDRRVIEMIRLMIPIILFWSVNQSWSVFERYFASGLPDGSLSYLGYARKISNILVTMVATGVSSAIFPAMARAYSAQGEKGLTEQSEYGFRLTFASALPTIFLFGAAAVPVIMIVFEHGAFTHDDTVYVSQILLIVLIGDLLFRMLNNVNSRMFFVVKDTVTFPIVNALMVCAYIGVAKLLTEGLGYIGLALAFPIQGAMTWLFTTLLLTRRFKSFNFRRMFRSFAIYFLSSLLTFCLIKWVFAFVASQSIIVQLTVAGGIGFLNFLVTLYWVDRDIVQPLLDFIASKIGLAQVLRCRAGLESSEPESLNFKENERRVT